MLFYLAFFLKKKKPIGYPKPIGKPDRVIYKPRPAKKKTREIKKLNIWILDFRFKPGLGYPIGKNPLITSLLPTKE